MGILNRFGVSLDSELLHQFDSFIADKGYENRSEALGDLIRDRLIVSRVVSGNAFVFGTVTLTHIHDARLLPEKLTDFQHESHGIVILTLMLTSTMIAVWRSWCCAANRETSKS
jgi:CopG family nickel-responsive transcriptional regulator